MTRICLAVESMSAVLSNEEYEARYESGYKALGTLLYSNPDTRASLGINGNALTFLKNKHPEFLYLLRELVSRGQVEVIGGGYYDPVFPLLFARERTAQLDMLSSAITQELGKRPHTAMLYASAWDDSLVWTLKTNDIDCVLLSSSILPLHTNIPIVMSDRGKSIDIFPTEDASKIGNASIMCGGKDGVCTFVYSQEEIARAMTDGSFLGVCKEFLANGACLSTITEARSSVRWRVRAYINGGDIHDWLQAHEGGDSLYHRQTMVAMLIDQYHGDKVRKSKARTQLLSSQCGDYLFGLRKTDESYQMLNEADNAIHADSETVTAFDINEDGKDEYVCRMDYHTSVIDEENAMIISFDAMASLCRRYSTSLFYDSFKDDGCVWKVKYTISKFLRTRHEVLFTGAGVGDMKVSLRKKYIITSSGFVVQYIIKNNGERRLESVFDVSFRFDHITEGIRSVALHAGNNDISAVQLKDKDSGVSFLIEPNEDAMLSHNETKDMFCEILSLSWRISLASCMECEKTISFAMLSKDGNVHEEKKENKISNEQLNLWEDE